MYGNELHLRNIAATIVDVLNEAMLARKNFFELFNARRHTQYFAWIRITRTLYYTVAPYKVQHSLIIDVMHGKSKL